ncbi:WD repeat-containing protein 46 [Sigmodon hispidus]
MCEINVMEAMRDIHFLHSEALFTVAQNRWLYIYNNQGISSVASAAVVEVSDLPRCVLSKHRTPKMLLSILDTVTAPSLYGTVAVDSTGLNMATSGLDHQLKIFDLRGTLQLLSGRTLPQGARHLAFSQRGLLVAGTGNVVNLWAGQGRAGQGKASLPSLEQPYLTHRLSGHVHGLQFCPFVDVLGVEHSGGFTSVLVPGSVELNFDGLENNPYRNQKQHQEWEVKALLEKVPAELICLDPRALAEVDVIILEQQKKERIERLGYDPDAKAAFQPKAKQKGRSSTASLVRRKKKVMDQEHSDKVRQSLELQQQQQKQE